jgi:hypothetical protein
MLTTVLLFIPTSIQLGDWFGDMLCGGRSSVERRPTGSLLTATLPVRLKTRKLAGGLACVHHSPYSLLSQNNVTTIGCEHVIC